MSSTFRGSTLLTLPFSQSGQHRIDCGVDPTFMGDPEASLDLWFASLRNQEVNQGLTMG
jgi:hypothetical protein